MLKYLRPLSLALVLLMLLLVPVQAQDRNVTDDEVNEIARDVYCPVCENTPLDVCQTQACADWRELIRTKLAEGQNQEQIFDYFARQYGDGVLANPPRRGISLVILWILPVVLLLLGLLLFGRTLRQLRSAAPAGPEPAAVVDASAVVQNKPAAAKDDYLSRIEEELGKKDE